MNRRKLKGKGRYLVSAPENEVDFATENPGTAISMAITYASRAKRDELNVYVYDQAVNRIVGRAERRQNGTILAYLDALPRETEASAA